MSALRMPSSPNVTDGFGSIVSAESIKDTLYGDCATSQLVERAHEAAEAWNDDELMCQGEITVSTGRLLTALLDHASKDVIPEFIPKSTSPSSGAGVTGERYTAAIIVAADREASKARVTRLSQNKVRNIAAAWFELMLLRGTLLDSVGG